MAAAAMSFSSVGAFRGLSLSSSSKASFFQGEVESSLPKGATVSFPRKSAFPSTIESAHKKGAGSTKNCRYSRGQRLGVKFFGDRAAKRGAIVVGQRRTKFHPGKKVGLGKDHTIFSLTGRRFVKFEKFGPDRKKVSVYSEVVQPENPDGYRARKREYFRLRRELRKTREGFLLNQN